MKPQTWSNVPEDLLGKISAALGDIAYHRKRKRDICPRISLPFTASRYWLKQCRWSLFHTIRLGPFDDFRFFRSILSSTLSAWLSPYIVSVGFCVDSYNLSSQYEHWKSLVHWFMHYVPNLQDVTIDARTHMAAFTMLFSIRSMPSEPRTIPRQTTSVVCLLRSWIVFSPLQRRLSQEDELMPMPMPRRPSYLTIMADSYI